jgi:predicted amidohydrolase
MIADAARRRPTSSCCPKRSRSPTTVCHTRKPPSRFPVGDRVFSSLRQHGLLSSSDSSSATGIIYNTAALIRRSQLIGKYRKSHITANRNRRASRPARTIQCLTQFGKIGIMICYDGFSGRAAAQHQRHGSHRVSGLGLQPIAGRRAPENHVFLVAAPTVSRETTGCSPRFMTAKAAYRAGQVGHGRRR